MCSACKRSEVEADRGENLPPSAAGVRWRWWRWGAATQEQKSAADRLNRRTVAGKSGRVNQLAEGLQGEEEEERLSLKSSALLHEDGEG